MPEGSLDARSVGSPRIHLEDPQARPLLASVLREHLAALPPARQRRRLILCIGTDRSTGDALGPLVGTILSRRHLPDTEVWGTLDEPVHASNLREHLERIRRRLDPPLVIAVDACLGRSDSVGTVSVGHGPLRPGAGVHKDLPAAGDLHLTGTVNVGGFKEFFVLQNTRLSLVVRMAELIADGLLLALEERQLDSAWL